MSSDGEDFGGTDLLNLANKGAGDTYRQQNLEYQERQKKLDQANAAADYDEMDYGDEFNDDEEKRYRKETYGEGRKDNEDEEEEEGEEESSEPEEVVPMAREFSRRANRGQKMTALVNKAADEEEEDDFWAGIGAAYFGGSIIQKKRDDGAEGEEEQGSQAGLDDDISFNSGDAGLSGADSFDSDFGRSSDEGEEGEAEQSDGEKKVGKKRVRFDSDDDEDRQLELQEKREAARKKTNFQKSIDAAAKNKREKKQAAKEAKEAAKHEAKEGAEAKETEENLRKSNRIKKRREEDGEGAVKEAPEKKPPKPKSEHKASYGTKSGSRAPVGSLTNNPEWLTMIAELERAEKAGLITTEQYEQWKLMLRKDKLDPLEKMQEAAFTELINTRSLEQQKIEEDLRMKEIMGRREQFKPDEKVFKYRQSSSYKNFLSEYVFPSVSHYPKGFNTRDTRGEQQADADTSFTAGQSPFIKPVSHIKKSEQDLKNPFKSAICPITGNPAKYRDPLTGTPYANKEAFKIIREKFFMRDEEKLFVRLQVLQDLLQKKRDKLKNLHQCSKEEQPRKVLKYMQISEDLRNHVLKDNPALQNQNYFAQRKQAILQKQAQLRLNKLHNPS